MTSSKPHPFTMTHELKHKWVKALRSGKYTQGRAFLKVHNTFCCLGVLCDIVDSSKWIESDEHAVYVYKFSETSMIKSILSSEAEKAANLTKPILYDKSKALPLMEVLTRMNDCNHPFSSIADYIIENVETTEIDNASR